MPYKTQIIKTKKLKLNHQTYIGFYLTDLYSNQHLTKLINESFNHQGLTYINKLDLPKSIITMFELEFIPINKNEESTWILHESKEMTMSLLDFIENEFEDDISDFEMVIVYEEECYNLPINVIKL